jgi:hypothetical protein
MCVELFRINILNHLYFIFVTIIYLRYVEFYAVKLFIYFFGNILFISLLDWILFESHLDPLNYIKTASPLLSNEPYGSGV